VEQLAGHGGAPPRGPDHRHRTGLQEGPHGGRGGHLLAPLEPLLRLRRQRGRELDQQHAGDAVGLDREAGIAEDLDHLMVLGQHLGIQHLDAELVGRLGELAEQDRAEPLALHGVGDLERHLGPVRMVELALEAGVADHSGLCTAGGD
jgi:hypothetical protein